MERIVIVTVSFPQNLNDGNNNLSQQYTQNIILSYRHLCLCFTVLTEIIFKNCGNDSQDKIEWRLFSRHQQLRC